MDRRGKLLAGLDLDSMVGLEIGALDRPTLRKSEARILYADHLDTDSLRRKYANDPNVNVGEIVDVDAVWGERTLAEALGPDTKVDYILASHVVEHVPDLISWLQELRAVLKPGGQVRLVVPDKRFTFDFYRQETVLSDVLAAYLVRARKPLLRAVVDFVLFSTTVDHMTAWNGEMPPEAPLTQERFNWAHHIGRDVLDHDTYHDVHCWVVTPRSFAGLFAQMAEFGVLDFTCAAFHDTEPYEIEFCVVLQETADPAGLAESWRRMGRAARRAGAPVESALADAPDASGELQAKTIAALGDWGAAERARARAELARSFERSRADAAEHERWEAKALREHAEARARAAEAAMREAEDETRRAQETVRNLLREREALLNSGVWQATRPIRALVRRVPPPLRNLASRALGRGLRIARGRPGGANAARQREQVARIEASRLFDAGWYVREYRDLQNSNVAPALHYLLHGAAEGRNPGPDFDSAWYLAQNRDVAAAGINPLLHFIDRGEAEGRAPKPPDETASPSGPPSLHASLRSHFAGLQPLRTFPAPGMKPRLTMITDSINAGSLFGGVGTAMILAALLAERRGLELRLITRSEPPETLNFQRVLDLNGVPWKRNIEFIHAGIGEHAREIPVGPDELFLTTSWWSTRSARQAVDPRRIVYLLQEDERMFYPHGDEWLRCAETLADPQLRFVVNSELLFEHLARGPLPLASIAANGVWFEPAFPAVAARADDITAQARPDRYGFFFYARPGNQRNLYYRGLEAIGAAMQAGALPPDEWDVYFVGRDLEPITLPGGVRPVLLENLDWADYQTLVRRIDVGLSLMYTPHPSYPPLDLAAAGAVVVTNRYGAKTSLARYADDILCVEPSVEALAGGIADAVRLAKERGPRRHASANRLQQDWGTAFEPVLQQLAERL